MRLFQLASSDGEKVAVEFDRGLIDFTEAFQAYNFITKKRMMMRICSIRELISLPEFSDDLILSIFDYLESHSLWDRFVIEGDYAMRAPVTDPGKILCVGLNYMSHAAEGGQRVPDEPIFFGKAGSVVIGNNDHIRIPPDVGRVDHELELAVIIGKTASRIDAEHFQDYVAGYTIFNDVTARDMQKRAKSSGQPWFLSKNFDTFGPMGPCMITPRELPYPFDLDMTLKVNGEIRQKSNTGNMVFKIPHLLATVTRHLTLHPGDVLSTGTSDGVSPLKDGDVVEAEIEKIGVLKNHVETAHA